MSTTSGIYSTFKFYQNKGTNRKERIVREYLIHNCPMLLQIQSSPRVIQVPGPKPYWKSTVWTGTEKYGISLEFETKVNFLQWPEANLVLELDVVLLKMHTTTISTTFEDNINTTVI